MDPVVHFEMPYRERERMAQFYQTVFGWQVEMLGPEMGDYVLVTTALADVRPGKPAGAIDGGFYPTKPDWPGQHPSIVIAVQQLQTAIKLVESAGGEVLGEPMEIPGIGLYVAFRDSEGNRCSMLQPAPSDAN